MILPQWLLLLIVFAFCDWWLGVASEEQCSVVPTLVAQWLKLSEPQPLSVHLQEFKYSSHDRQSALHQSANAIMAYAVLQCVSMPVMLAWLLWSSACLHGPPCSLICVLAHNVSVASGSAASSAMPVPPVACSHYSCCDTMCCRVRDLCVLSYPVDTSSGVTSGKCVSSTAPVLNPHPACAASDSDLLQWLLHSSTVHAFVGVLRADLAKHVL